MPVLLSPAPRLVQNALTLIKREAKQGIFYQITCLEFSMIFTCNLKNPRQYRKGVMEKTNGDGKTVTKKIAKHEIKTTCKYQN